MDSSPICRKRAVEELARGREFANKLQRLLNFRDNNNNESIIAEALVDEVLSSFINTLSLFNFGQSDGKLSHIQGSSSSSCRDGPKSESFQEITNFSPPKNLRGCCKRSKISHSRYVDSSNWMMQDGYSWRKYGQKEIQGANFPRNYYRCTHKNEQGCKAIKHVQRIREQPPLYRTTYFGHHTCKNLQPEPQIFFDDTPGEYNDAVVLSFGSKHTQADSPFLPFVSSVNMEQECNEDVRSEQPPNQSSPSTNLLSSQSAAFDRGDDSSPANTYSSRVSIMDGSDEFNFWDVLPPRLEDLWQE